MPFGPFPCAFMLVVDEFLHFIFMRRVVCDIALLIYYLKACT